MPNPSTEKLLYSRKEAAELLGVSLVTLWQLTRAGELTPRYVGNRPLYSRTTLAKFAGVTA